MARCRVKLRKEIFLNYGNKCTCCGELSYKFLTIDHVNNDGKAHRKQIGSNIYNWLKTHKYPAGFQILCWNCNIGRKNNDGICPHKEIENANSSNNR